VGSGVGVDAVVNTKSVGISGSQTKIPRLSSPCVYQLSRLSFHTEAYVGFFFNTQCRLRKLEQERDNLEIGCLYQLMTFALHALGIKLFMLAEFMCMS
jgi:hypothetical protein